VVAVYLSEVYLGLVGSGDPVSYVIGILIAWYACVAPDFDDVD
jgi:hypothetical protein